MWLRDAASGKILSVKPFGRPRCKPLIVGGECIPDRAPPTLVAVVRAEAGTRIVPALYSTTGGLVEGTPFTLCDADGAACDSRGKLRLTHTSAINFGHLRNASFATSLPARRKRPTQNDE